LFVYCNSSPIINTDNNGYEPIIICGVTITVGQLVACLALIGFWMAYICDKAFRDSINQMIWMFIHSAINSVGYIVKVLEDAVTKAKENHKKYNSLEEHHIVAQTDRRAKKTRDLIRNYGISTYVKQNKVYIKKKLHKHIHTNSYHAAVYLLLRSSVAKKKSWFQNRQRLLASMVLIGLLLRHISDSI
jgi:hypothetical protein